MQRAWLGGVGEAPRAVEHSGHPAPKNSSWVKVHGCPVGALCLQAQPFCSSSVPVPGAFPEHRRCFVAGGSWGEMFLLFSFSWLCLRWGLSILTLCRVDRTKHTEVVFTPCCVLRAGQPRVQERACLSPVSSILPR